MSSTMVAVLFAILGIGLAVTSTACFVLWKKVRSLTSPSRGVSVAIPDPRSAPRRPSKAVDEVARRVDELVGRHRALEARLARVEASTTGSSIASAARPRGAGFVVRVDPGGPEPSGGPTLISVPDLASHPLITPGASTGLDRRFGPVWAMADDGIPVDAIARETGYPIGQVELILGLRRQLASAGSSTTTGTGPDG